MKWINALRSGDYHKGRGSLKHEEKYCCLGVLDDIFPSMCLKGGSSSFLSNYKKIGLTSSHGWIPGTDISLAVLNDARYYNDEGQDVLDPLNFNEIADVIQAIYVEEVRL